MDKNTFIGIGLIIAILIGFQIMSQPSEEELAKLNERKEFVMDSIAAANAANVVIKSPEELLAEKKAKDLARVPDSLLVGIDSSKREAFVNEYVSSLEKQEQATALDIFSPAGEGDYKEYTLENDQLIVKIANKGGRVISASLKGYQTYDNYMLARKKAGENGNIEILKPLELFNSDSTIQYFDFLLKNNKEIKSYDLYFDEVLATKDQIKLRAKTQDPRKYIEYTYTIANGYDLDYNVSLVGLENDVDGRDLNFVWQMTAPSTEKLTLGKSQNQSRMSSVFYKPKEEGREYLSEMMATGKTVEKDLEWVAFKQGYFSSVIMGENGFAKGSFVGAMPLQTANYTDFLAANLDVSTTINSTTNIPLKFYFGPNDYDLLATHGNEMEDIIDLGWGIFRVVNKYLIMPIFNFFNGFGWNLGLIILIVTIIVRLLVLPLTYRNYKSSAKMKVLKPEIKEIADKYKGKNAAEKQRETMALYRRTGVNPMAGCLPMFIQMPVLIAVFRFFPSSLELRQKSFLWAEDLSTYESIMDLGFTIPAYGSHVSLFTLLLCISTIFYTRMNSSQMSMPTQEGAPNMKVIMYLMPIMMLFFLNSYASGLTFYYFCGNLLTMGLMLLVKKYLIDEKKIRATIELNKTKPKKQSAFQKRMQDLMEQQQAKQTGKKK